MTRNDVVSLAERSATEIPMADRALVAGIVDILIALDVIRVTSDLPSTDELHQHKTRGTAADEGSVNR